tara:strand:+ start:2652 stop:3188 length:537 start_codon:yes stop_codon:yes gene_type:complete
MKILNTRFKGLKIIKQKKFGDKRGFLRVTYNKKKIKWNNLIFDYVTTSKKNALRGFHFQSKFSQAKFISVIKGKILDCVIDLRKKSKTFGKSYCIILSENNCKALYVPQGFAHAYYSFDKENIIYYRLSNYYHPEYEDGIIWNDKTLKIKWPTKKPLLSKKDKNLKTFSNFKKIYRGL